MAIICDSGAAHLPTPEERRVMKIEKLAQIGAKYGLSKDQTLQLASDLYNNRLGIVWALYGKPTQTQLF